MISKGWRRKWRDSGLDIFILKKEGSVLFNDTLNTFSYGYMASHIWQRTIQIARK